MIEFISGVLTLAFVSSLCYIYYLSKKQKKQKLTIQEKDANYQKLLSQKKSSEVRTGQIVEQLAPFLNNFKYDPKKIKFIGMPIDYIYFGEDEIVIVEVKSGNSQLSPSQNQLKKLVEAGKVRWETYRLK